MPPGRISKLLVRLHVRSGLGGLPFLCTAKLSAHAEGAANAVACGVMLAVSFDLMDEMYAEHPAVTGGGVGVAGRVQALLGLLCGAPFIVCSERWLEAYERRTGTSVKIGSLSGVGARRAIVIVMVMTVHSACEGLGVGISWAGVQTNAFISVLRLIKPA